MGWKYGLVLVVACLACPGLAPAAGGEAPARGGNAALMERWVEQRRLIRDEVLATLRRQGRLPEDGTVSFEAVVAPDPGNRERLRVRLQSIEIVPAPGRSVRQDAARASTAGGGEWIGPLSRWTSPGNWNCATWMSPWTGRSGKT
jgi:hypothetical protein